MYKTDYTWTDKIAYAAGLIASDGCLSSDGRHIELTSTDPDQLENFKFCLGRAFNITRKFNKSGQPSCRIQFGDVALYDFLMSAGISPRKSKTIGRIEVPDEFYGDFLRGIFDGDGSTYGYFDKRWKSSFMFYVIFTSASEVFVHFIQSQNKRLTQVGAGSIRRGDGVYNLSYAKNDGKKIYDLMYANLKPNMYLARKKEKLEGFISR